MTKTTSSTQDPHAETPNILTELSQIQRNHKTTPPHPNFDTKQNPIDPNLPLTCINDPINRPSPTLAQFYQQTKTSQPTKKSKTSKKAGISQWDLVQSPSLLTHLNQLQKQQLIHIPKHFHQNDSRPLLPPLTNVSLIDLAEIQAILRQHHGLTHFGFMPSQDTDDSALPFCSIPSNNTQSLSDWQAILCPKSPTSDIALDILPVSITAFILSHCTTRKSMNTQLCDGDICQYVRSYLLSQCQYYHQTDGIKGLQIFRGHVIIAAIYLGWKMHKHQTGKCHFNVSSRSVLFTRYPNFHDLTQ